MSILISMQWKWILSMYNLWLLLYQAESLLTYSEPPSEDSVSMTVSSHITSRRNSNSSTSGALHLRYCTFKISCPTDTQRFQLKPKKIAPYFLWHTVSVHIWSFVAGVIKQERFPAFEKVLWRLFHGNFVLRHAEIQATEELQAVVRISYSYIPIFLFLSLIYFLSHSKQVLSTLLQHICTAIFPIFSFLITYNIIHNL